MRWCENSSGQSCTHFQAGLKLLDYHSPVRDIGFRTMWIFCNKWLFRSEIRSLRVELIIDTWNGFKQAWNGCKRVLDQAPCFQGSIPLCLIVYAPFCTEFVCEGPIQVPSTFFKYVSVFHRYDEFCFSCFFYILTVPFLFGSLSLSFFKYISVFHSDSDSRTCMM